MTRKHTHPRDLSAIGGDPSRRRGTWKHIGGSASDEGSSRTRGRRRDAPRDRCARARGAHRGRASQKITVEHVHVQGAGAPAPAALGAGANKIVEINPMQSRRGGRAGDGRGVDAKVGI
jgi:hypothetical protein